MGTAAGSAAIERASPMLTTITDSGNFMLDGANGTYRSICKLLRQSSSCEGCSPCTSRSYHKLVTRMWFVPSYLLMWFCWRTAAMTLSQVQLASSGGHGDFVQQGDEYIQLDICYSILDTSEGVLLSQVLSLFR